MKNIKKFAAAAVVLLVVWFIPPVAHKIRKLCPVRPDGVREAQAVAQWGRKYNMSCTACHTAFPRLTDFGEQFKMNGYQMIGTEDGDEHGKKKVTDNLTLDELGNYLGVRLAFSPLQVKTKSQTINREKRTLINTGKVDWLQLFVAGSIFKNVSIFIETEISGNEDNKVKTNWFYLGFHNLAGPQGLLNLRIGNIPQMDWHVLSGRLRMIPNISNEIVGVKSASGATGNEDQVPLSTALPGAELAGYYGSLWYSAGAVQGKKQANDPNREKNYFGNIALRKSEGDYAGSQISVWAASGADTKNSTFSQVTDHFWRISPGVNIRRGPADLIAAYYYGEDSNGKLAATPKRLKFSGIGAQLGYSFSPKWWGAVQYDRIFSKDDTSLEFDKISPSLWYFIRENMRVGLTARFDLEKKTNSGHKDGVHEYLLHLRTMF